MSPVPTAHETKQARAASWQPDPVKEGGLQTWFILYQKETEEDQ
jgi:hypothetical protein